MSLLHGLSADEVGVVVSEALHALRAEPRPSPQRGLDAELVEAVAACVAPRVTFGRLAAGVRLLRRVYDAERESMLSAVEIRRLKP
jgi:hypothetical protein